MNKYLCFYRGKTLQVEAETSYEASRKAAKIFKAKRPWDVSVILGWDKTAKTPKP
jgi:hypothetical protein